MIKSILTVAAVLSCCVILHADYLSDRKAALELVKGAKNEEALLLFTKMAEGPYTDFQKSDALEQAAMTAQALKKGDQAMELAKRIPLVPASKTVQMRLMNDTRNWQGIVDAFKNENIEDWPEELIGEASHLRGQAYYQIRDGKATVADLEKAAEYLTDSNSKGLALNMLGDTYASLLKDDARALETYRSVYKNPNIYKAGAAAMGAAGILAKQNKLDEAMSELKTIDMDKVTHPYWRASLLAAYGGILSKQGKKSEAISKYKEAAELKDIPASQKALYEKIIKDFETDTRQ